ncbi:GNAT domain-containing protein [Colletotrichum phormii]|uniref:GNAT domain-containing protein n=1 Tax=Colletotrichum phormii TaxID=359342 RepID=A0AAJ0EM11_9PEZI|nr:GNAT domain-containing protein [Colletotrichum phormii]KAK1656117.1 GNAT domain-containing protein [Colletotrichum phormii]
MCTKAPFPIFWLEPLDLKKHLQGFHELSSDEKAALWSTQLHTTTLEASKERMVKALTSDPWHLSCAITVQDYATKETSMIGIIRTTRASAWGLSIGYKLRSDCWGKGYATRAIRAFLEMYWSRSRVAPREEVFVPVGTKEVENGMNGCDVEITHLIAQVDPENVGSMKVSEKCGGRLVAVEKECVKVWRFGEMRDMAVWRFDKPFDGHVESI